MKLFTHPSPLIGSRHIFRLLSLTLFVLLSPLTTSAQTFSYEYEGTTLNYSITDENTVEVARNTNIFGDVIIPEEVVYNDATYSVTSIGKNAFYQCFFISIIIPESVTSIGEDAFYNCSSLRSVTIPKSVTSIGVGVFSYCTSLQSIEVDSDNLHYTSLDGVLFDKELKNIHTYPVGKFNNYYILPNSVTSISDYAFINCESLESVTIPESMKSIGVYAFYDCSSLTSVAIPGSVTSIGANAFEFCSSLTSVTIPKSVTSIGVKAFSYCGSLESIEVNQDNLYYASLDGVLFDKQLKTLLLYPEGKSNNNYTIPNSVTSIGESAFSGCSSLTSIILPESVTSIGEGAFSNCSSLTSVIIPESVTSIGEVAFYNCSSLTSIILPESVTSIGDWAFSRCTSLTSVTISESVKSIGAYAFSNCSSLTSITLPESVTSIGDYVFYKCSSLTSITLPESLTSIGESAFSDCSSLISITIPDSMTSIANFAFTNCSSLTSVNIPESVTSIGFGAFSFCSSLTSITIPASVTSIYPAAFYGCHSLISVTIPKSVTSIMDQVFSYCTSLQSIEVDPDNLYFISKDGVLFDKQMEKLLNYPAGKSNNNYIIPETVTYILLRAFCGCSSLTSVTIPESVTSMGNDAFLGCSSLNLLKIKSDIILGSVIDNSNTVLAVKSSKVSDYQEAYPDNNVIPLNEIGFEPENYELDMVADKVKTLALSLEAYDEANGFQLDVTLPEGLSIAEEDGELQVSFGEGTAPESSSVSASKVSGENAYRIVGYSSVNAPYLAGENLLNIALVADENFDGGEINITNVLISRTGGEGYQGIDLTIDAKLGIDFSIGEDITIEEDETLQLEPVTNPTIDNLTLEWSSSNPDVAYVDADNMLHALMPGEAVITAANAVHGLSASVTVTVSPVLYGDSNDNGAVSIDDIVTDVHYILEKDPQPFSFKKADVNRDRAINILDVSKTVAIVLSDEAQQSSIMRAHLCEAGPVQSSLSADNVSLDATGRAVMRLHFGDESDITALQGDIRLPEGLHVRNITLSGEQTGDHLVSFAELKSGAVRFAVYSMSLAGVTANTPVLDIELEGDTPYIAGEASVYGIYASDIDCNLRRMADINAAISIPTVVMETEADADAPADVYTPQGVLILRNATSEDIRHLAPGLYIIGGNKILVK